MASEKQIFTVAGNAVETLTTSNDIAIAALVTISCILLLFIVVLWKALVRNQEGRFQDSREVTETLNRFNSLAEVILK